jgi:hypothetical protein
MRRMNGFEMRSPENVLSAYARLKNAPCIVLEIGGNGRSARTRIAIR